MGDKDTVFFGNVYLLFLKNRFSFVFQGIIFYI